MVHGTRYMSHDNINLLQILIQIIINLHVQMVNVQYVKKTEVSGGRMRPEQSCRIASFETFMYLW